jgi:hypothetical protein
VSSDLRRNAVSPADGPPSVQKALVEHASAPPFALCGASEGRAIDIVCRRFQRYACQYSSARMMVSTRAVCSGSAGSSPPNLGHRTETPTWLYGSVPPSTGATAHFLCEPRRCQPRRSARNRRRYPQRRGRSATTDVACGRNTDESLTCCCVRRGGIGGALNHT